jgi:hypothetical protein
MTTTKSRQNQSYDIHLERYFLDCVWRDSDAPDAKLTANSGTSRSNEVYVTFYVGDISRYSPFAFESLPNAEKLVFVSGCK